jgi:hypothetical protein
MISERVESRILVGSQDGNDRSSRLLEISEKFRCHSFPIHHDVLNSSQANLLFVALH